MKEISLFEFFILDGFWKENPEIAGAAMKVDQLFSPCARSLPN